MDFDLSLLDANAIGPDATRWLALPELGFRLRLASATEANPGYWSAALPAAAALATRVRALGATTPTAIAEERKMEVGLYAAHVVKGWDGVKRADGEPVPFSAAAALELLSKIVEKAPRFWTRIDRFASNPENFTRKAIDAEALAGNL